MEAAEGDTFAAQLATTAAGLHRRRRLAGFEVAGVQSAVTSLEALVHLVTSVRHMVAHT